MTFSAGHALIIGIGHYRNAPEADVPIALDDAQAVFQVLQEPGICGYPPDQVRMLTDVSATREGVLTALDALARRAGSDDTIFLFYCGHGAYGTDEKYHLVSHDAQIKGARVISGTGISESELLRKLGRLRSSRVLMVFNTCYSGNISPALDIDSNSFESGSLPENSSAAILGTGSGRIIITASRESQKSFIGPGVLSIFTQALVDGLRGEGLRNNAGFISAYGLYEYVYKTVTQMARELVRQTQEPELTVMKGIGPFAVSLFKGSDELGRFVPEQIPPHRTKIHYVDPEKARILLEKKIVDTGGGAYIEGDVNTGGGSIVGRDQTIKGDQISIGDVTNSNLAIGRGARATITPPLKDSEIKSYFLKLNQIAQNARSEVRPQAMEITINLEQEIMQGDNANDKALATLISDLVELVPQTSEPISQLFSDPTISGIAGEVTRFVLEKMR